MLWKLIVLLCVAGALAFIDRGWLGQCPTDLTYDLKLKKCVELIDKADTGSVDYSLLH